MSLSHCIVCGEERYFLVIFIFSCKPPLLISQLSLRVRMKRCSAGLVPLEHDWTCCNIGLLGFNSYCMAI